MATWKSDPACWPVRVARLDGPVLRLLLGWFGWVRVVRIAGPVLRLLLGAWGACAALESHRVPTTRSIRPGVGLLMVRWWSVPGGWCRVARVAHTQDRMVR